MRCLGIALIVLSFSFLARAEMSAITVPASVAAFDAKSVTLKVNQKKITVPRRMLQKKDLKTGEAVQVTFRGKDISYLLSEGGDERRPASEKNKK